MSDAVQDLVKGHTWYMIYTYTIEGKCYRAEVMHLKPHYPIGYGINYPPPPPKTLKVK
jgi:hypothetical protein